MIVYIIVLKISKPVKVIVYLSQIVMSKSSLKLFLSTLILLIVSDLVIKFLKNIYINEYTIELVKNKQFFYKFIYSPSLVN